MVWTCISGPDYKLCKQQLQGAGFAELRLDLMQTSVEERLSLYSIPLPFIVTCRPQAFDEAQAYALLEEAVLHGAAYLDVEIERSNSYIKKLATLTQKHGCQLILSYHNYVCTPSYGELSAICRQALSQGADIVKLACMVNTSKDNAVLLGLYKDFSNLVSFGMGEQGRVSRIASLHCGAPFIYVAAENTEPTATGQYTAMEIDSLNTQGKRVYRNT
jgi:3-dehydroquinate dehydratase type I